MTATPRPQQQSMFPELRKPVNVGPLVGSVITGNNADLLAAIAPLYLHGRTVLDVTYGRGRWWTKYRPESLVFHDLAIDGVDFTDLPYDDKSFDVVCYDPPYQHGTGSSSSSFQHQHRFGTNRYRNERELTDLMIEGLKEALRVSADLVLAKSMRFIVHNQLFHGPFMLATEAVQHGYEIYDHIIHHSGVMPGNGWQIRQQTRATVRHSDLLVFRRLSCTGR